jgi:hypothetical protein
VPRIRTRAIRQSLHRIALDPGRPRNALVRRFHFPGGQLSRFDHIAPEECDRLRHLSDFIATINAINGGRDIAMCKLRP